MKTRSSFKRKYVYLLACKRSFRGTLPAWTGQAMAKTRKYKIPCLSIINDTIDKIAQREKCDPTDIIVTGIVRL